MDKDKKKYKKSKAEKLGDEILRARLEKKRQLAERGGVCGAFGIDPERKTHLGFPAKERSPVKELIRTGEEDKKMVSVEMLKSRLRPDGTEKYPDLRAMLNKGITYTLPISEARILIKEGSARDIKKSIEEEL